MSELIDRYVSATLRTIPDKQRSDLEAELRTSIGDAVEARVDAGDGEAAAEAAVLTDLGDPDRLAASYTGSPGYLIGPELFFDYKRLLKVLLITVVPIIVAVLAVLEILSGDGDLGSVIAGAMGGAVNLAVHVFFWTTLVFVVIERTGETADVVHRWKLSDLPDRTTVATIGLFDTAAGIAFVGLFIGALIAQRGLETPFIDPDLWSGWMWYLIAVLAAGIVFDVAKYRIGRWTWTLASVNVALAVLFAAPALWLLFDGMMINPEFVALLDAEGWAEAESWLVNSIAITIGVIFLIDVGEGLWKARKPGLL